jgi:sterol desaturase/sphingolipid hydroxylase (fatty acid hydroxylase superfamily)
MIMIIAQIFLGFLWSNFLEWFLHKNVLHGMGRDKGSYWSYHWRHHKTSILNKFYDAEYEKSVIGSASNFRESFLIAALVLVHFPLLFLVPVFYLTTVVSAIAYYVLHSRSHRYPEWGKRYMRWHYDHHMRDSNSNWCVTLPVADVLLNTYKNKSE